jgi:hypothetical protein
MKTTLSFLTLLSGFLLHSQLIAQGTIGPIPDGVRYSVISNTIILKADAGHCGFNDLSFPNIAEYRRETRLYTQYQNRKEVKSWTETFDVFLRCKPQ